MRHRRKKVTLDRTSAQRRRLIRNLSVSLVVHERVVTTEARAKAIRSFVERLVTLGKNPTLHHRRQLLQKLPDEAAVKKILTILGPRYAHRAGGYLRILRLAPRQGDGAAQRLLEFIPDRV